MTADLDAIGAALERALRADGQPPEFYETMHEADAALERLREEWTAVRFELESVGPTRKIESPHERAKIMRALLQQAVVRANYLGDKLREHGLEDTRDEWPTQEELIARIELRFRIAGREGSE